METLKRSKARKSFLNKNLNFIGSSSATKFGHPLIEVDGMAEGCLSKAFSFYLINKTLVGKGIVQAQFFCFLVIAVAEKKKPLRVEQ